MPRFLRIKTLFSLIFLIGILGCKKENDFRKLKKDEWEPGLAAPLINSELKVGEIIEKDGLVRSDSLGRVTLIYDSHVQSIEGKELIDLQDISTTILDSLTRLQLPISNGIIDSIFLKRGTFNYSFTNPDTNDLNIDLSIPSFTNGGDPLNIQFFVPGGGYHSGSIDLSGYSIDLQHVTDTLNSFLVHYQVWDANTGQIVTNQFPLNIDLHGLLFEFLKGYLGTYQFSIQSDTIPVSVFRNWTSGEVRLEDPRLFLRVQNTFGFPITGDISTFEGISPSGGTTPVSTNSSLQDTFLLQYPNLLNPDQTSTTTFILNDNNSNLNNVISATPSGIHFGLSFLANLGADSSQTQFMAADSKFTSEWSLELPLYGRIKNAVIQDTFEVDKGIKEQVRKANSIEFKLRTINSLPFDMELQFFFLDRNGNVLDSLLDKDRKIFSSPGIDDQGNVISSREKVTTIQYEKGPAKKIDDVSKVAVKTGVSTTMGGDQNIRIHNDNGFRIRLGTILYPER